MLEEQPVANFKCPSSPSNTVKCKTAKKKGKERRTENDFAKFKHCSDPSQYWHALNLRENTSLVQLQMTVNLNEQLECVWGGGILKHTCIYKYAQFLFLSVWHWIILWYDPLQTLQPHTQKNIYIYWESFSSLEMNSNVRQALQLFFGLVGLVVLAQEKRRERWIWEAVLNLSRRPCGTAMLWHSAPPKPHLKRHFFPGSRLLWIPMRFRVWQWIHSRRGVGGDLWPQDSDPQYWSWPTANQSEDYSPLQSCGRVPRGRK